MSLAADTHMGRLELRVRDMPTMLTYYTQGVGLEPLADEPGSVTLGHAGTPIVRLTEARDLRPARRTDAGLFHTAVLYEELPALAATLLTEPPTDGVDVLDLAAGVGVVAELVLEPLQAQAVDGPVGQDAGENEAGDAGRRVVRC